MQVTEIRLNFKKNHFEEIYFRNGNEKIFFSKTVKEHTYIVLFFGTLFLSSLIYSISTNTGWGIFILLCIPMILSFLMWLHMVRIVLKWRKSIKRYIEKICAYSNYKVVLSENTFSIIADNDETIEKWSELKQVEIDDLSLILHAVDNYMFPKKSISAEEFDFLKTEIGNKVKNGTAKSSE